MTVTLQLSEEESQWVQSQPKGEQEIREMIRARMNYDRRATTQYSEEARKIVERAKQRAEASKEEPFDRDELAQSLRDDIVAVNTAQNGQ